MSFHEDKERDFQRREAEMRKREMELRLRELELEVNKDDFPLPKTEKHGSTDIESEPPLYNTKKHHSNDNKITRLGKNIVRYGKFIGFVVIGIALAKAGVIVGLWLTNTVILAIFGFIGYKLFIESD